MGDQLFGQPNSHHSAQLEDEAKLFFRILASVDGNNSSKHVASEFQQAGDIRQFFSSYWMEIPEVNKFKPEDIHVKGPEVPPPPPLFDEEEAKEMGRDDEPSQQKTEISECVRNWKAAQTDSKKHVMEKFDETSWFSCGCRYGLVFWVVDMVKTGEQCVSNASVRWALTDFCRAKYPLSIINRVLDVLSGKLLIGYDIGCLFELTIKSTTLRQKFIDSGSHCCVNTHHGYAHNYACQVQNHPNNIEGAGIEDFETQKRLFLASNATASIIRYASKYQWRVSLNMFLKQNNRDKYANLGLMLKNNYQQALNIINNGEEVLDKLLTDIGATRADLNLWQTSQAAYFATLGKEPEEDVHRVAYVELLQEFQAAE